MYEFGTTSEQLAESRSPRRCTPSTTRTPCCRTPVTVEEVLDSPMLADPLHRLDCCVVTDGGGAVVVVQPGGRARPRRAAASRSSVTARRRSTPTTGASTSPTPARCGRARAPSTRPASPRATSTTRRSTTRSRSPCSRRSKTSASARRARAARSCSTAAWSRPTAGCPFNTDGGGLCNNHPGNRGGMTKIIEAVRQLRGEAHPAVQVPDCQTRAGPRHGRLARHPHGQRDARARTGGRVTTMDGRR